jgi:mono/diheme cytochrome c family protein
MNNHRIQPALSGFLMVALLCLIGAGLAHAQFTQNREKIHVDASGFPPEIQKDYKAFRAKCSECHTLDTGLKPSFLSAQWTAVVKQMQAMPSSHFNDKEAQSILDFLNYDESHRKAQAKSQASPAASASTSVSFGQQVYFAQRCDTCHSIAGKGGDMGPALNSVGAKLSRDQLTQLVRNGKPNTAMPALPPGTTDQQINALIDFLVGLK